ncbi:unnamed protein product [Cyprideis torosa]|uniref:Uncharacterized protein n=1 Tax=Cyprideis torosa TaxID=163714 RepID=A0A7R8WGW5_9CRUS|nr:unnamed protein product [Cyprideis torosa]CAG0897105.1 unnamed protein product [Cyprideis torosa]
MEAGSQYGYGHSNYGRTTAIHLWRRWNCFMHDRLQHHNGANFSTETQIQNVSPYAMPILEVTRLRTPDWSHSPKEDGRSIRWGMLTEVFGNPAEKNTRGIGAVVEMLRREVIPSILQGNKLNCEYTRSFNEILNGTGIYPIKPKESKKTQKLKEGSQGQSFEEGLIASSFKGGPLASISSERTRSQQETSAIFAPTSQKPTEAEN